VVLKPSPSVFRRVLLALAPQNWHDLGKGYVYVTVIINLSQAWAMYCLVLVSRNGGAAAGGIQPWRAPACGILPGVASRPRPVSLLSPSPSPHQFYHELAPELARLRPLGKFVSVKLVVFFSFWCVPWER
jgi:hypothetical protein